MGPTVAAALDALVHGPCRSAVLTDLVDAGVEPERPAPPPPGRRGAAPGRSPGKTVVVTGTLPGSAARRPRRRSGPPAASPAGRSAGRRTTSSPARTPARSWPRRRSWASRCSTRTGFRRLLAGDGGLTRRQAARAMPRRERHGVHERATHDVLRAEEPPVGASAPVTRQSARRRARVRHLHDRNLVRAEWMPIAADARFCCTRPRHRRVAASMAKAGFST